MSENKVTGPSATAHIDGFSGKAYCSVQCILNDGFQWQCPFCMGESMPPKMGSDMSSTRRAECFYKDGCTCRSTAARIDALKRVEEAACKVRISLEENGKEE